MAAPPGGNSRSDEVLVAAPGVLRGQRRDIVAAGPDGVLARHTPQSRRLSGVCRFCCEFTCSSMFLRIHGHTFSVHFAKATRPVVLSIFDSFLSGGRRVSTFALDVSSFSVSRGPVAGSLHASTFWPSLSFELRMPRIFAADERRFFLSVMSVSSSYH